MKNHSRRQFLKGSGSVFGGSWLSLNLPMVLAAAQTACTRMEQGLPWQNITAAQAEGFAAVVDQIIPPDESPGASETGVVYFLDEVLNSYLASSGDMLKTGLAELESMSREQFGRTVNFSGLSFEAQTGLLLELEDSDWFEAMIELTQLGMFALPDYGGNKNHKGWELIGFEHQHAWQPPFGHYDNPEFSSGADDE